MSLRDVGGLARIARLRQLHRHLHYYPSENKTLYKSQLKITLYKSQLKIDSETTAVLSTGR
jgi:hypothetical protein